MGEQIDERIKQVVARLEALPAHLNKETVKDIYVYPSDTKRRVICNECHSVFDSGDWVVVNPRTNRRFCLPYGAFHFLSGHGTTEYALRGEDFKHVINFGIVELEKLEAILEI